MLPLEERLITANPWWGGAYDMARDDPHIRRYEDGGVRWDPPAFRTIAMTPGDTHTLRGPRQAGKTTTVKRLIQKLLAAGERRVLYFSCDQERDRGAVQEIIWLAKQRYAGPPGPWYVFLDEVTSVPEWPYGVKYAFDSGLTTSDAILLTGSSAHDLKRGAERLPGRRGNGEDYVQLPMSFRDYCHVTLATPLPLTEPLAAEEMLSERGRDTVMTLSLRFADLRRAFGEYLAVGGFPAAVRDARHAMAQGFSPRVRTATLSALWSIIAGVIGGSRRDPLVALKLLQTVGTSLGSPMKWSAAAEAMGVEKPDTAREYTALLAEIFLLLTVYFWDIGSGSVEPKKQRKLYYMDPLLSLLPRWLVPGTRRPSLDGVVENLVAVGLFRSAAKTMVQSNAVPGAVAYWRSTNDRELDFLVPFATDPSASGRFPIEVKGDNATRISEARRAIQIRCAAR